MRTSRIVLAGVAVATAAAAGTAFTAANTLPTTTTAGYGTAAVTGAAVSNIAYATAADPANLARVTFTSTTDVTGRTATLTLRSGTTIVGSPYSCVLGAYSGTSMSITCDTTDNPAITSFNTVGLTVVQ